MLWCCEVLHGTLSRSLVVLKALCMQTPLLTMDVWEHACVSRTAAAAGVLTSASNEPVAVSCRYYLDEQNKRPSYISTFVNVRPAPAGLLCTLLRQLAVVALCHSEIHCRRQLTSTAQTAALASAGALLHCNRSLYARRS